MTAKELIEILHSKDLEFTPENMADIMAEFNALWVDKFKNLAAKLSTSELDLAQAIKYWKEYEEKYTCNQHTVVNLQSEIDSLKELPVKLERIKNIVNGTDGSLKESKFALDEIIELLNSEEFKQYKEKK